MRQALRKLVSLVFPGSKPGPLNAIATDPAVEASFGTFTVEVDAETRYQLVYEVQGYDPVVKCYLQGFRVNEDLVNLLRRFTRPGDCVLDLGAHVGTFSLAAAALGHKVIAVDASPKHIELLRRSVAQNGFDRMHVVHAAIAERSGTIGFHVAGLWGMVEQPGRELDLIRGVPALEVPAVPGTRILSQQGVRRLDFIKMDIEGSEVAAVRSLKRALTRKDAPVIVYECNNMMLPHLGHSTRDLLGTLEQYGYRNYRIESGRYRLFPSGDFQPELYIDLIALKPRHEQVVTHEIDPPLTTEEIIQRTLLEARQSNEAHRITLARSLAHAPRAILHDPRVQSALESLSQDSVEAVRNAASWHKTTHGTRAA
ncbi:MAG: hypothetical protein NVSMB9_18130 [Isosphaeraceae bacterium]